MGLAPCLVFGAAHGLADPFPHIVILWFVLAVERVIKNPQQQRSPSDKLFQLRGGLDHISFSIAGQAGGPQDLPERLPFVYPMRLHWFSGQRRRFLSVNLDTRLSGLVSVAQLKLYDATQGANAGTPLVE